MLGFCFGRTLPAAYRGWVLRNATARTWLLRELLRGQVVMAPILGALLLALGFFGGSWPIAGGAALLGILVTGRFTAAYAEESVDARLARHGFPRGHSLAIRRGAGSDAEASAAAAYRARWSDPGPQPGPQS